MTEDDIIQLINEIKFKLRAAPATNELANELNLAIDKIIFNFVLDQEPGIFASKPKNLPDIIPQFDYGRGPEFYKEDIEAVYSWIPDRPITVLALIDRCIFNSVNGYRSDINSALISLKEEGRILIDDENMVSKC